MAFISSACHCQEEKARWHVYPQLAIVKQIINIDCEGLVLAHHRITNLKGMNSVVRMPFPQLETLVCLLLTIPCTQ